MTPVGSTVERPGRENEALIGCERRKEARERREAIVPDR